MTETVAGNIFISLHNGPEVTTASLAPDVMDIYDK